MPSDVWLSQLEVTDRTTVRLHGASYLEAGVYDFVRWLEQAPGFAEVALKRTSATTSAVGPDDELRAGADAWATLTIRQPGWPAMNNSLIRKFCESRYRWPIVATATALLALAAVAAAGR